MQLFLDALYLYVIHCMCQNIFVYVGHNLKIFILNRTSVSFSFLSLLVCSAPTRGRGYEVLLREASQSSSIAKIEGPQILVYVRFLIYKNKSSKKIRLPIFLRKHLQSFNGMSVLEQVHHMLLNFHS